MSDRPHVRVITAAYPSATYPARGRYIQRLHEGLARDFRTEVLAPKVSPSDPISESHDGISVTRFDYGSDGRPPKQAKLGAFGVAAFLRSAHRSARTLWSATSGGAVLAHWVVPSGWIGMRIARRLGVPLVLYAHGSDLTRFGRGALIRPFTRKILRSAAVTLCASEELSRLARSFARRDVPTRVVPVGVGPEFGPVARVERSAGPWRFLFVGDLVASKGAARVAEAFEVLRASSDLVPPGLECTVIGEGPYRGRLERVDGVRCLGVLDEAQVAAEMREADALLLPSVREGTPIVVQEAITSQLPVIATDVGGISRLFDDRSGWTRIDDDEPLDRVLVKWMSAGFDGQRTRVESMMRNETESLSRRATVDAMRSVLNEVCR